MSWESELFWEVNEEARVLPPESGTPNGLDEFKDASGILVQPIIRRRNYLTRDICHMNVARSKRPGNILGRLEDLVRAKDNPETCPFGPGKEHVTPRWADTGTDYARIGGENWQLRAFPNLYPWLLDHLNIVETPEHKASSMDVDPEEEFRAMNVAAEYCREQEEKNRYVVMFRNQGLSASLAHFHWQIGALSFAPSRVAQECERAEQFYLDHERNIFESIIEAEKSRSVRWVGENDFLCVLAPFAPRTNNELWIIFKDEISSLSQTSEDQRRILANVLTQSVRQLFAISGNDDLFILVHQLPPKYKLFRLHIELFPVKPWSGAERGFGELVVEHAPETTAGLMRERLKDVF